jgi:hypothetical protein
MKKILLVFVISISSTLIFAQSAKDALHFSTINYGGDARYTAMGGAFGALGGNMSTLHVNPAGIGLYRSSEFTITPVFTNIKNRATYNSSTVTDSKHNFQIANIGIILTSNHMNFSGGNDWKIIQFGISVNQLKNFHNQIHINGNNPYIKNKNEKNSISDMYASMAKGKHFKNNIEATSGNILNPIWNSYLINLEKDYNDWYYGAAPKTDLFQSKRINTWGSMYEVALSFGANYNDRLYVGATIGLPVVDYNEIETFTEEAEGNIPDDTYRSATIRRELYTHATGVNLKLGVIFKANDFLRFGAAIHTPTYYPTMQDEWIAQSTTRWDKGQPDTGKLIETYKPDKIGLFEYNLTTPMRAILSTALVLPKYGIISFDYEFVDYSLAKFNANEYDFEEANNEIRNIFTTASNFCIGTEWKLMNFSFRGGYNYHGNPFKNDGNDGTVKSYSLGLGYRESNFYVDVAWVLHKKNQDHYLYGYGDIVSNPANVSTEQSKFLMTFGFRF